MARTSYCVMSMQMKTEQFQMSRPRMLPVVCATLALAGCAAAVTPVVAVPGPNKDVSTFQKEEADCRSTAAQAVPSAGPNTNAKWASYFSAYAQCANAHGDRVQPVPWNLANVGFGTPYPAYAGYYGYGYGYPYAGYPYGFYDPFFFGYPYGFYPGFFGFGYGFGYGRFAYGYGGFHGGGFRGGFAGGGFHGGGGFHH